MKLYLVRHAKSRRNAGIFDDSDSILTEDGKEQARRLGKYFHDKKINIVICSKLKRAKETLKEILLILGKTKIIYTNEIREHLFKLKIKKVADSPEIYADIAVFLKNHDNCIVFISVDDKQYSNFERFVEVINGKTTKKVKESKLKKDSREYKISLVLDTLLNIERLKCQ